MSEKILEVKNITKDFIGVRALNDVSISLMQGEILALLGENGAGKSTLMKILSGAHPCNTYIGDIFVDNEPHRFHSPRQSEHAGIKMIYQETNMIPELSVAENIYTGNFPNTWGVFLNEKKMFELAKGVFDQLGICIDVREKVRNLSTSQQQLVAIAKALSKKCKILILDEPTSAITATETSHLFNFIKRLKENGVGIIYISHKLDEVFELADRVVVMRNGCVVGEAKRSEFDSKAIVKMMIGRSMEEHFPDREHIIGEELLRVENLSIRNKVSRQKFKVENINFEVRKGEVFGIAGLVGSGRSETANAIFGNEEKNIECNIYVQGKKVSIKNAEDAIQNGIALITEDRKGSGLISCMSIRENITLPGLRKLFPNNIIQFSKEKSISKDYFGQLSIKAPSAETKVRILSGGNQQKVVIAKWLMLKPKLLIMDEPTRGIDVGSKYEIYKIINNLVSQGVGVIMISSEMSELIGMCDRIIVLASGKVKGQFLRGQDMTEENIMLLATGIDANQMGDCNEQL